MVPARRARPQERRMILTMRATIERAALRRALRIAVAESGRRRDAPPLRRVRIGADPGTRTLRLDASDGTLAATLALPAAIDAGWCRAVAARPLAALVADLPDGPLT